MAADVAKATNGTLVGQNAHLSGVSFDSRSVRPGQLFVPIVAERDGHEFVLAALAAGAGAYLTTGKTFGRTSITVPDTLVALLQLGAWGRNKIDAQLANRVVGITGSVGKTSTKDFVAAALGSMLRVTANERSFNNDQGLPVTILNAPDDVQALVLEMGMRGFGEIARLCTVARPNIGVVTKVASAHTERVGDIEGVARAKSELVTALDASGFAILNADDDRVVAMQTLTSARVITYGVSPTADVRMSSCVLDERACAAVVVESPWGRASWKMNVPGEHMAHNAVGAIAVAGVMGLDLQLAADAISMSVLSEMRMQHRIARSGALIIDDSYNANPASMAAALHALSATTATRRIAVLGVMAELSESEQDHLQISRLAKQLGIEIIAVETDLYEVRSRTRDEVVAMLSTVENTAAILIKGSRVAQLEKLVSLLVS
ncbi:MAG: UDP-N-acetylmuramoyl-tripeptide--D-alanyl-D-alanine ligase [Actinobacteria bacterium]|nr:MAG: UDP-N-acetylmuramoyl-tripeptide--D-alanyl-D-alanine ligase [Actinomycetota bacterium]